MIPLQGFAAEEILTARRLLEVGLAGQAVRNANEDDSPLMAEEVTEMHATLDNRQEFSGSRHSFSSLPLPGPQGCRF